jgi:hypothetical protein
MSFVTALPADPRDQDPLDPARILQESPERERENFLSQYREALDGARDPAGWKHLRRVLRMWSWMVIAASQPGQYEAREQVPWTMTPDWSASTVWCGSADPDAGPPGLCSQNHV